MFAVNSYAKIKEITKTESSYIEGKLSITKKNKQNDRYELSFFNTVRFLGSAKNKNPQAGQRIKITNCGVQNVYYKGDELTFMKMPQFIVFDYELQEDKQQAPAEQYIPPKMSQLNMINDEPLPF